MKIRTPWIIRWLPVGIGMFMSALVLVAVVPAAPADRPPRLLVLTDMGADPDDEQSLVRLLLYANQIDLEGLVATTSCWHQHGIRPDFIHTILNAYGKVQPNLLLHEPGFPTAGSLRAVVKNGLPKYGMTGVGEGMDSEGSDWIIRMMEKDDERPLWISVWGGPNTLAQALFKLRATRPAAEVDRLVAKLRVYTISAAVTGNIDVRHWQPPVGAVLASTETA